MDPEDARRDFMARIQQLAERQAELARAHVKPSLFLPGEDPLSPHPDDAAHWASVYRELVEAKEAVQQQIRDQKNDLPHPAKAELAMDEQIADLELQRLRLHLDYWQARQAPP
jgi:hypothetical protein